MVVLRCVVLNDRHSAVLHVVEDAAIINFEILSRGISAHSKNNGVEFREIAAGQVFRREEMNVDA